MFAHFERLRGKVGVKLRVNVSNLSTYALWRCHGWKTFLCRCHLYPCHFCYDGGDAFCVAADRENVAPHTWLDFAICLYGDLYKSNVSQHTDDTI